MRSDQTDPESWHWIVPVWVDRKSFLAALDIPNEKQVVALLVDRQGHVLWRSVGPMTPDKRASLMTAAGLVQSRITTYDNRGVCGGFTRPYINRICRRGRALCSNPV